MHDRVHVYHARARGPVPLGSPGPAPRIRDSNGLVIRAAGQGPIGARVIWRNCSRLVSEASHKCNRFFGCVARPYFFGGPLKLNGGKLLHATNSASASPFERHREPGSTATLVIRPCRLASRRNYFEPDAPPVDLLGCVRQAFVRHVRRQAHRRFNRAPDSECSNALRRGCDPVRGRARARRVPSWSRRSRNAAVPAPPWSSALFVSRASAH